MSFLFTRNKPKTPQEVVFALNELVSRQDATSDQKILEEITRLVGQATAIAYGEGENDPDPDQMSALSKEIYNTDLLINLVANLASLEFESKRQVTLLFTFLLRRQVGSHSPTVDYMLSRRALFEQLISALGSIDTHRQAGTMLRGCAKSEELAQFIQSLPDFWLLFDLCREKVFEVGTESFLTLSEILMPHKDVTSRFLKANHSRFIKNINSFLTSENYVMRRQFLRLQSRLIILRCNSDYMLTYVCDVNNLKLVMRLMRDKSKVIHYESFQLFKVFVANPNKPQGIYDILVRNKVGLLDVLDKLKELERKDDNNFKVERNFVIQRIQELPDVTPSRMATPSASPMATPHQSPSRSPSREPDYPPSGPPSPSRAQVPHMLNLNQVSNMLGGQVPNLDPPSI